MAFRAWGEVPSFWLEEPEAVTMRPEIGREQFAHVAVGTPAREVGLSQGRRDFVGESFAGEDLVGRGSGRVLSSGEIEREGSVEGLEMEIDGVDESSGRLMVGIDGSSPFETLMIGSVVSFSPVMLMVGIPASSSSGRLIVGMTGAETLIAGMIGLGRITFRSTSWPAGGESPGGFHAGSKLTIGRPGRSVTAVGVGSFGLRSLNRILVAARMSSLRISILGFDKGVSTSGMISIVGGVAGLAVYAALRDCEGGFRKISQRSSFFVSGVVLDRPGRGRDPRGNEFLGLFCRGISLLPETAVGIVVVVEVSSGSSKI